jgi:predicted O-methyltransferase YrrM
MMNDSTRLKIPETIAAIEADTRSLGFSMASDYQTGCLLRTLASTKPGGRILELGTGTGLSTCWLLDGMDQTAKLVTVDNDENVVEVAKLHLGQDSRVVFHAEDGSTFLEKLKGEVFDLIFADTWPGKIWSLDAALNLMADGGMYVVDDMSHQAHWPEDHLPKIDKLIEQLEARSDMHITKLNWSTGIMILTKKSCP